MTDFESLEKEVIQIEKDILTARRIIHEGILNYKKKKLKARSKKAAEDMALRFKDLELYESERDIQDAYGYGSISLKEYDRLCELWALREKYVDENGKFSDSVTEMLEAAYWACGERHQDKLREYGRLKQENEERKQEQHRAEVQTSYELYKRGLG